MTKASAPCPCCATLTNEPADVVNGTCCSRCGHRWRIASKLIGDPSYYEQLTLRNDEQAPWFARKIAERTSAVASLIGPTTKRILEIGCAEGGLGQAVKTQVALTYDGVELSRDADKAATRLDQVFRHPSAKIQSTAYDLIVCFHVLEHIDNLAVELSSWHRLLAGRGALLVEVPNRAGHPWLDNDYNPEHLHQFTSASLVALLASQGFDCQTLSIGHYESPLYCDSIRVVARPELTSYQRRQHLLQRFANTLGEGFIAYGAGGDYLTYVAPLADILPIRTLVDSAPEKWGIKIGTHRVTAYNPNLDRTLPILICSLRFGEAIRQQLLAQDVAEERLVTLDSLLAGAHID